MSRYASLLVATGSGRRNQAVVSAALGLAVRFGACLTGLHVNEPCYRWRRSASLFPVWDGVSIGPQREARARAHDAALKKDFQERTRRAGRVANDWRYAVGDWVQTMSCHAVSSDLLIMHQHGADIAFGGYDAPAEIALRSGRPVLVWPYQGHTGPVGEQVALAWDGSREAVAAMTGALPLLVQASRVDIVMIKEHVLRPASAAGFPDEHIVAYLSRHGVNVRVTTLSAPLGGVENALRTHIIESRADLLCMGAYGHFRLREIALGGTTFDMMRHMLVPTLIAS